MRELRAALLVATIGSAAFAGGVEWDSARGSVRSLSFSAAEAPQYAGSAVEVARAFLAENRALFNGVAARRTASLVMSAHQAPASLGEGAQPELEVTRVDDDQGLSFVRLQQMRDGLPVEGGDVVVAVRDGGAVTSVQGGYAARAHEPRVGTLSAGVGLAAAEAMATAKADLAAEELGGYEASALVWWVDADGQLVKAHRVDISAVKPRGDWRIHVDAATGRILSRQNMLLFHDGDAGTEAGSAEVYLTNPLREAGRSYVSLKNLTGDKKRLVGTYVKVLNGKGPTYVAGADGNFVVEESSPHFGEITAYYAIDRIHENLKQIDPAFTGMDWQIPITAHDKGSFFMKNDNAYYSPFKKAMFILDPKKLNDLHLEASVSYHEYHHAVTDAIVPGLNSTEGRAMHEGYSDYFACALTNDPEIGEWALKPLNRPNMRDLRSQRHYPEDLHPQREPHSDGEIWAASCWDLRAAIPADKADFLVHKSRSYLSSNATFKSAYEGMLKAADDFLGGQFKAEIQAVFEARGIAGETAGEAAEGQDVVQALAQRVRFEDLHGGAE